MDGKSLLLGVTAQNIRLLAELDAQDGEASALAQQGQQKNFTSEADTSGLSQKFSQLLGRHTPPVKPKDML